MIAAKGTIVVDQQSVVVKLNDDILFYYLWLIKRNMVLNDFIHTPKYGAHVTIINRKIHGDFDHRLLQDFEGNRIKIWYDERLIDRVTTKGFRLFYLQVQFHSVFQEIAHAIGIKGKTKGKIGYHLTIGNIGKNR